MSEFERLLAAAQGVVGRIEFTHAGGDAGTVGAALLTDSDHIFTGICVDVPCSLGFCAEHAAVADMLKHGETHVHAMLAVNQQAVILPPCGRCRELISQIDRRNWGCRVYLSDGEAMTLDKLLPHSWLAVR